jgi:hypothetical protein
MVAFCDQFMSYRQAANCSPTKVQGSVNHCFVPDFFARGAFALRLKR